MAHIVKLNQGSCEAWEPRGRPDLVVTNPPWGNRLMGPDAEDAPLEATWKELGLFLKVCPMSFSLHSDRCASPLLHLP